MATEKFSNNAATTLSGAISDSALSLVVSSSTGFPTSGQFRIKIDNELILVTGVSGTTYTITRGQEGTTAVAHGDGAAVTHVLTAGALTQLQADTFTAGGDLSGTSTSQTVTKIQGTTLDPAMSGASVNDVLTWDGSKWTHLPSATASLSRYTPTDSNTILNWKFDETSGTTFTDSKLGVTLTPADGASNISSRPGFFNRAVAMSSAALATGGSFGTVGAPVTNMNEPPATACTISAWVFQRSAGAGCCVFRKLYRSDGSWAAPNLGGIDLALNGSKLYSVITIGGSLSVVDTGKSIVLGTWQHIANVYDGATLKSYINGQLVYSRPVTGSMDFGDHGPWVVGGDPGGENFDGFIEDARVEGVARSEDYLWALYRNGIGLFDQYQVSNGANLLPHLPILAGVESESLNGWKVVGSISFNPSDYNYTQVTLEVLLATSNASHAAKARLWNLTTGAQVGTDLSSTNTSTERVTQVITPTSGLNIYEVQIQTSSSGTDAICYGARLNLSGGLGAAPVFVNVTSNTTRAAGVNETLVIGTLTTAITVTLPASPTVGQTIKIKDSGGTVGTYNVTVDGNGKTLDGAATYVMSQNYDQNEFVYNGTSWMVC